MALPWFALAVAASAPVAGPQPRFVDPKQPLELLAAVLRNAERRISFNRRYVASFVPCGTACGSYWFVDRRRGVVIAAADGSRDGESVSDLSTRADSDVVRILYGPRDGTGRCTARDYRMTGMRFVPLGVRRRSPCTF